VRAVAVVRGAATHKKLVTVSGLTLDELWRRLSL
jgi:hypothetical protein